MPQTWTMRQDHELPSRALNWQDGSGTTIDFSDPGYTFRLRLVNISTGTVGLSKTTGFVGSATSPNLVIAWAPGELFIPAAPEGTRYRAHLTATIAGSDRMYAEGNEPIVIILPAVDGGAPVVLPDADAGVEAGGATGDLLTKLSAADYAQTWVSRAALAGDPAFTAGLTAHLADTTDAHDASAVSILDTGGKWTATTVEGALAEIPSKYMPIAGDPTENYVRPFYMGAMPYGSGASITVKSDTRPFPDDPTVSPFELWHQGTTAYIFHLGAVGTFGGGASLIGCGLTATGGGSALYTHHHNGSMVNGVYNEIEAGALAGTYGYLGYNSSPNATLMKLQQLTSDAGPILRLLTAASPDPTTRLFEIVSNGVARSWVTGDGKWHHNLPVEWIANGSNDTVTMRNTSNTATLAKWRADGGITLSLGTPATPLAVVDLNVARNDTGGTMVRIEQQGVGSATALLAVLADGAGSVGSSAALFRSKDGNSAIVAMSNATANVLEVRSDTNIKINNQAIPSGVGVISLKGASVEPSSNPTGGMLMWQTSNGVKFRFPDGTVIILDQLAAVPDATDAASAITQLNLLLARIRAMGLIA